MLLLIRKGLLRILTQLRRIARLLGETRDWSGLSQDTGRRDKEYGRSVGWRDKKKIKISNLTPFIRKENGDIGERTFEDYDVELINPPMLRLREDLSV